MKKSVVGNRFVEIVVIIFNKNCIVRRPYGEK